MHVGSGATLTVLGNNGINASARLHVAALGSAMLQSAAPVIGSLADCGTVRLGAASAASALTVGGDHTDFAFFGSISQTSAAFPCSVTKTGTGTWTLHGAHGYTGLTTVNAGRLKLAGSLAGGLTVGSGGGLTVDVGPDGATYGAVAGAVALDGALTVNFADGYTPSAGTAWTILGGASGYSGSFTSVSDPSLKVTASGGDLVLTRIASGTAILVR